MYDDILVVTDRSDTAEDPIRLRGSATGWFLDRLRDIGHELAFPTVSGPGGRDVSEAIEIRTNNATRHAIDLAVAHGARLHVLYFIDSVKYDTTFETAVEPLEEEGEERVERITAAAEAAGLEVVTAIEVGRPTELVLAYAEEHDVDLIVMNVRPRRGVRPRIRGSITETVVRKANVPVYAVPLAESEDP